MLSFSALAATEAVLVVERFAFAPALISPMAGCGIAPQTAVTQWMVHPAKEKMPPRDYEKQHATSKRYYSVLFLKPQLNLFNNA